METAAKPHRVSIILTIATLCAGLLGGAIGSWFMFRTQQENLLQSRPILQPGPVFLSKNSNGFDITVTLHNQGKAQAIHPSISVDSIVLDVDSPNGIMKHSYNIPPMSPINPKQKVSVSGFTQAKLRHGSRRYFIMANITVRYQFKEIEKYEERYCFGHVADFRKSVNLMRCEQIMIKRVPDPE